MKSVIVAPPHNDHGKTALVKALPASSDRLEERSAAHHH